jgi:nucleoside-diphosphate-sugar epimerase
VPGNFYAATKIAAEALVASYAGLLDTAVVRLVLPYGPGQTGRLLPAIAGRVRDGRPVTVNGGGAPRMNPIYVGDVVRILLALTEEPGGRVLKRAVGIDELAGEIGRTLGREPVFETGDPSATGDIVCDTARLHAELPGIRPLVGLEEGLRLTLAETG